MSNYGTHDFKYLDFGEGVNLQRIAARSTRNGVSFGNILTAASTAMAATTSELNPVVGLLTTRTDQMEANSGNGAAFQVEFGSEYAVARPQRLGDISHFLPLGKLDAATQFTEEYLDNATELDIARKLNAMVRGYRNAWEFGVLNALFNPAAVRVSAGSTVMAPKFIGYDSNDPAYGEISLADGTPLASPYSHYINDTPANLGAAIASGVAKLKAGGAVGPFDIVPTSGALAAISALPEWVAAGDPFVINRDGSEAGLDPNIYAGVLNGMNVRVLNPVERVQDGTNEYWFAIVKSNGSFAEDNPVAWRYDAKYGVTPILRSRNTYPLDYATVIARAGFAANNRFGAVLVNIENTANGYTAPVIRG